MPATRTFNPRAFFSMQLFCALVLILAAMPSFAQTFTSLLSFNQTDGANPYGTLIEGPDGNFYGTTQFGGSYGQGAVFKVTPAGAFTTLYSFCAQSGCTDGDQPFAGLVLASNGNFYGTTLGTAFTITPSGDLTTIYHFCSLADCADGNAAYAALIQGADGNFYGTTAYGGAKGSCGTVFKLTPGGVLTTLQKFRLIDGCNPFFPLVQAPDGNFYGGTSSGGSHNYGTIFRLTPAGLFTLLYSFDGTHGIHPSQLLPASNGKLYGTTQRVEPSATARSSASPPRAISAYCTASTPPTEPLLTPASCKIPPVASMAPPIRAAGTPPAPTKPAAPSSSSPPLES